MYAWARTHTSTSTSKYRYFSIIPVDLGRRAFAAMYDYSRSAGHQVVLERLLLRASGVDAVPATDE